MSVYILSISLLLGGLLPAQAGGPPLPANADPESVASWQEEIEEQFRMLTAAYDLDESAQALLQQELQRRMNEQYVYDQAFTVNLGDLAARIEAANPEPGSPEDQAFSAELGELANRMPLAPDAVALWTEGQVPAKVAAEGRVRYQELRGRKDQQLSIVQVEDPVRMGGMKKEFIDAKETKTAPLTPDEAPLPLGPKGEQELAELEAQAEIGRVVEPNQGLSPALPAPDVAPPTPAEPVKPSEPVQLREPVKPPETKPQRAKTPGVSKVNPRPQAQPQSGAAVSQPPQPQPQPGAAAPQPQPPPKVAPLDEWDNYVIQVSGKYRFTDAQVTKAQAILRDLRRRAYQYQVSRAADFARAELITDAKVKQARLGELNRPLAALFGELKQRLESLPTSEQRQQAEAGVKKPVGKK